MSEMAIAIVGLVSSLIMAVVSLIFGIISHKEKKKIDVEFDKVQKQNTDYQRLLEDEKTRNNRKMILEELKPIYDEMASIKKHITDDEKEFEGRIDGLKNYHNNDRDEVAQEIDLRTKDLELKILKIVESYKFRFIQLCKTHINDGYITNSEWEQIVTFYDLYHSLGGNGQAEDYYEQVKKLDLVPDVVE